MSEIQHTFGNGFCLRSSYSDVKEGFTRWLWTALESLWWRGSGLEASCLFFPFLYMIWGTTWDFSPFLISGLWGKARKISLMWSLSTSSWTVRNCLSLVYMARGTGVHVRRCGYAEHRLWSAGLCVCFRGKETQFNASRALFWLMYSLPWGGCAG